MDDCRLGDRVKSQSSQLIEEAWCDVLSSLPPPTGPVKRPASQNPSLGGILKRHITIREFENNETEIQRTEQEKVKALLSKFENVSKRDKLVAFVRLFKRLDVS